MMLTSFSASRAASTNTTPRRSLPDGAKRVVLHPEKVTPESCERFSAEALGARHVASLEAQLGEAEATHTGAERPVRGELAAGTRTRRRAVDVLMLSIIGPIRRLGDGPLTLSSRLGTDRLDNRTRRRAQAAPVAAFSGAAATATTEREVGHVAKPSSSLRSASSRCAMRSPEGRPGSGTGRTSRTRAARRARRAPRRPRPRARRRARRARGRARSGRAARARRGRRGRRAGPSATRSGPVLGPRLRPHDVGPAPRVELGDRPRVREQREPDRERQRLERRQQVGGADERDRVRRGGQRPRAPAQAQAVAASPAAASGPRRSQAAAQRPPCPVLPRSGGGGSRGRRRAAAQRPAAPAPRPR